MPLANFLASIVSWVRSGYPDGVPEGDYVPLLALLGTQLSERECETIALELALNGDGHSEAEIKAAITRATNEKPQDGEIARVRAHLAEGGWPLAPVVRDKVT